MRGDDEREVDFLQRSFTFVNNLDKALNRIYLFFFVPQSFGICIPIAFPQSNSLLLLVGTEQTRWGIENYH